jgi:hypothetical protein
MKEVFEHAGLRVTIEPDALSETPDEWNEAICIASFHPEFDHQSPNSPAQTPSDVRVWVAPKPALPLDSLRVLAWEWADGDEDIDVDDDPFNGPEWDRDALEDYLHARECDDDEWVEYLDNLDEWESYDRDDWEVFLIEAYVHGGVVLALAYEGRFPDRGWDVSQVGAVFIRKDGYWRGGWEAGMECPHCQAGTVEVVDDEVRCRGECGSTWPQEVDFRSIAKAYLDTWNQYLSGDVWVYTVERVITCDHCGAASVDLLDSCIGIYGQEWAVQEAKQAAEMWAKEVA